MPTEDEQRGGIKRSASEEAEGEREIKKPKLENTHDETVLDVHPPQEGYMQSEEAREDVQLSQGGYDAATRSVSQSM